MSGFKPAIVVIVSWPVCPQLNDFVLSCCIEASAELEHYSDGVGVSVHVDKVFKLIDVCLNIAPSLEVLLRFQSHEGYYHLILRAEG
jgi:hypothetical protein